MIPFCAFLQHRKMPLNLFFVKCEEQQWINSFRIIFTLFFHQSMSIMSLFLQTLPSNLCFQTFFPQNMKQVCFETSHFKKHFNEKDKLRYLKIYNKIILRVDHIFINLLQNRLQKNFQMQIEILIETYFEPMIHYWHFNRAFWWMPIDKNMRAILLKYKSWHHW